MVNGHYHPLLVIVSILVGVLASYTALSLVTRVKQTNGRARYAWVTGGALAMGSGIWAMHFIGMQAFRLPLPIGYDAMSTFVSWLLPVISSGLALWQVRHRTVKPRHLAASALLMGLAINAMHYTGMASMQMHPAITYIPWLFALSVLIAISVSALALQIGMRMHQAGRPRSGLQLVASVVMGSAIAGMHYTGMAAAHFAPGSVCRAALVGVDQDYLAALVTLATVSLLGITLLATIFDARLAARNETIAASLVAAAERQKLFLIEQQARLDAENVSQMKDDFLATLSHELRTPLNAMLGWSQLLLQGGRDEAAIRRGLGTIERNARAQSELIEDMLDMSRLLAGKVRIDSAPLQPHEFIDAALDTTRPAALARQVTLVSQLDAGAGRILGDSGRMQQVLVNLLSNAIKFSEPGGVVSVTLRAVAGASEITVQDAGAGIPAAFLPFVFDRFRQADASSTRRHGGLGLGLAIARQLIDLQGGTLSVASEGEGKGAAFTLRMPLASSSAATSTDTPGLAAPAQGVPLTALALQGLTVLVIDDALDSLELVQAVLAPSQATILTATGAQEALRLIGLHRPDLIISDIGMPVIDGFEFIRKVRALPDRLIASVPVIALTAFSRREDEQKVLAAGFDEFLAKPLVPAALLQTVAAVNARRSPAPAPAV